MVKEDNTWNENNEKYEIIFQKDIYWEKTVGEMINWNG